MSQRIACFGEFLLRMSPEMPGQWINQATMPVYLGGAEYNVASALASWKEQVQYLSALPENSMADDIVQAMEDAGIHTSAVLRQGSRIGMYMLPQGADLKNSAVIYDRAHSAFAEIEPGTVNWKERLSNCNWFHFSAITPALSAKAAQVCKEAVEAAAALDLTISVDLNYRNKLWKYGVAPSDIMPELVKHCTIVMGNIWSAEALLGTSLNQQTIASGSKEKYLEQASITASDIRKMAPNCKWVANTFRFDTAPGITYYATIDLPGEQHVAPEKRVPVIIDKVGSGDCFMAGLIYQYRQQAGAADAVLFAATAATGKLQEKGDITRQSVADIQLKMH